ncbi:FAD-dependent oxidoreductase [Streptomyces sp. DSM 44915]|uniref:FAD-dependent oxidoreductase n=1 Tax=Streptomyces chisholmiae TaxID=3075540 RepID=A0ABU2JIT8_9ACTN|nr:FAD-dependent oxidoreductase [Streptomyces sp. DSM 44915]MDT0264896.1 FAD-dependent oxidoreductase [Streptomyces sp. DSM 44915]
MLSSRTRRTDADVVIIGAGPAGLSAAHRLTAAGLTVIVLEAGERIGGRLATELRDGFRLDRSSQLTLPDSPALAELPRRVPLRRLTGGVQLHGAGPVRQLGGEPPPGGEEGPEGGAGAGRSPAEPFDQIWLRANLARLGRLSEEQLSQRPESTAAEALARRDIPTRIADAMLRPALAALLHDPELATSSRLSDAVLRAFARHGLALAEGGAAALPEALAAELPPDSVRTGVRVTSVATTRVETAAHGVLRCRAVLVATGAATAARLLPGLRMPRFHQLTVLHHAAPALSVPHPALLVEAAARGPVAHSVAASAADPSRAPAGQTLLTSVIIGPAAAGSVESLDRAARPQLSQLYGVAADRWRLLAAHHDPQAVPVLPPPYRRRRPARLLDGLYVCGDHRDLPGITGDLNSARRASLAVLDDLGCAPAAEDSTRAAG